MSQVVTGVPASPGVAVGPLYLLREDLPEPPPGEADDPDRELFRLEAAVAEVTVGLAELEQRARDSAGDEAAEIFAVHAMFLEDPEFTGPIREAISGQHLYAERAVQVASERLAEEFAALGEEYFAARAADIRDLARQLRRALAGLGPADLSRISRPSIIVAHDLTPSDTVTLPPGAALGFCTLVGSAVSHTAILARSMGVPAVVGVGDLDATPGTLAVIDGEAGILTLDPSPEEVAEAEERSRRHAELVRAAQDRAHEPAETLDGHLVEVVANVGNVADADAAVAAGAEGIGLLRTEFLFLERERLPSEEEQTATYREIFTRFPRGPVVVRTLDVGGDKQLPSIELEHELNPFLGRRGIRLTLSEPELFRTQLRAILRAGAGRSIQLMFPMVSSREEVREARRVLDEAAGELDAEGTERARDLEVGIMVEVPSAAVLADLLAPHVDFFSIGTNDLTQYTLAVDRTNASVAPMADALHPAVLRLIRQVVEAAHGHGRWVGICGELGGDPVATPVLLGLGLDELSMSPPAVPVVKDRIRRLSRELCRELARRCLEADSPEEVRRILSEGAE